MNNQNSASAKVGSIVTWYETHQVGNTQISVQRVGLIINRQNNGLLASYRIQVIFSSYPVRKEIANLRESDFYPVDADFLVFALNNGVIKPVTQTLEAA